MMERKEDSKEVTVKERKLIELLRSTDSKEVRVTVQHGQPVLVEEVKKSIRL
ncbi:DUF2292 domain-containing protein [Candidatus Formimonas warabiya]|nr:DUF2292 domain-containing protein [Candidatus Formimonas warabiya]